MSNVVTNCNCATEANILAKYGNIFPDSFVECVRQGCTWLASHNNITYQTSTLVRTDAMVYNNSGSSVLKIGLVDVDRPTTGLTQYDVISVKETKDLINGCTIYTVKAAYKTPMGIELTFIPIKYFDPNKLNPTDYYTVSQVDELLKIVQEQIDLLKAEPVITKEQLNTALAEYVLSSQHDQDIAVINKRIDDAEIGEDQEHTTFLTITKAEELYVPKTQVGTLVGPQGPRGEIGPQGPKGSDGVSPTAQEVAIEVKDDVVTALTTNEEFKAAVKGEKGDTGAEGPRGETGPEADTSTLATKAELADYVKTETLTTELEKKVNVADFDTYKGTIYTKEEADKQFEAKAAPAE